MYFKQAHHYEHIQCTHEYAVSILFALFDYTLCTYSTINVNSSPRAIGEYWLRMGSPDPVAFKARDVYWAVEVSNAVYRIVFDRFKLHDRPVHRNQLAGVRRAMLLYVGIRVDMKIAHID